MTLRDALLLGRVSNLPTVWTNCLAGAVLAGADSITTALWLGLAAMTLAYIGGMYLNDAFDAGIDAVERPERPIPSGRVSAKTVYLLGFGMLAAAIVILYFAGQLAGADWRAAAAGVGLSAAIVLYNAWHKANPISPFIMGVCRMMVYVCAAYCVTALLPEGVLVGAVIVLAYLIGLTYVAKQEKIGRVANMWPLAFLGAPLVFALYGGMDSSWTWLFGGILLAWVLVALRFILRRGPGDIPRAVISLIAGISIVDAILIAATGSTALAVVALLGFGLTLALQRLVPGT